MQENVGIVIVSYHNPEMTIRYVTQELPKLLTPYTVVVVNVASTCKDSKKLADRCGLHYVENMQIVKSSQVQGYLILAEENLGYARGNNLGVHFLNSIGTFSYYLFSNDDIEIKSPAILEVLKQKMKERQDIGCIGPRIIGVDGHDQSPHDNYISPYRHIGWRLFPFLRKKKKTNMEMFTMVQQDARFTYWVCGAFMMVDAAAFMKAGMFDEHTFLYYEEVIFSERLKRIGKRTYYEPSVTVLHYEGGSSTASSDRKKKIEKTSREYYYKEYRRVNPMVRALHHLLDK